MVKAPLSLLRLHARSARQATVAMQEVSRPPHVTPAQSVRVKALWYANDAKPVATRTTRAPRTAKIRPPVLSVF